MTQIVARKKEIRIAIQPYRDVKILFKIWSVPGELGDVTKHKLRGLTMTWSGEVSEQKA